MTNEDPYFRYVSDEHNYYIEEKTPFIQELEQQVTMTSVEEPNLQKIDDTIFQIKFLSVEQRRAYNSFRKN